MLTLLNGWKILLLALIQGISEIFPISSSGHLVVFSRLLHTSISFDLVVFFHIGTFLAILVKYRRQAWGLLSGRFGWKLLVYFALSFLTTGLVGLGVKQIADQIVSEQASLVPLLWIANGAVLVWIGWFSPQGKRTFRELGWREFILIGLVQGLTAIPGVSRLGMTLSTGLLLSLVWVEALDLSFLLSLPTIFFANVFTFLQEGGGMAWLPGGGFVRGNTFVLLAGLLLSFASGLVSIRILYKYLSRNLLVFFGLYCLIAGIFFFFFLKLF
jgi:undecaprenyl-diphosphatase